MHYNNSVKVLIIYNPNYKGKFSTFISVSNVNVVDVYYYPLLGLTASKMQIYC